MYTCRLNSEERNHQTLTKRFDDFFHRALHEAPEKYENTPAVVAEASYTNSFMVKLCSQAAAPFLFAQLDFYPSLAGLVSNFAGIPTNVLYVL